MFIGREQVENSDKSLDYPSKSGIINLVLDGGATCRLLAENTSLNINNWFSLTEKRNADRLYSKRRNRHIWI